MYRYKCVISQAFYDKHTADKQAFYDTVSEIKRRYPNCREIITKNKNSERTEQVLEVEKGVKICVRIDFSEGEVAAFSSSAEVLDGLGETAERIKISPHFRDGIAFRTFLSFIFCAVNIALVYIAVRYNYWVILPICWVLLFILYLISARKILSISDMSIRKLIFIQLGGFFTIALMAGLLLWYLVDYGAGLLCKAIALMWNMAVIPPVIMSKVVHKRMQK